MASIVEQHYQEQMATLLPKQRIERSMAMLQWTRQLLARQIEAEAGPMPAERLRWEVARRLYGADPRAIAMIDRKLTDVPH